MIAFIPVSIAGTRSLLRKHRVLALTSGMTGGLQDCCFASPRGSARVRDAADVADKSGSVSQPTRLPRTTNPIHPYIDPSRLPPKQVTSTYDGRYSLVNTENASRAHSQDGSLCALASWDY